MSNKKEIIKTFMLPDINDIIEEQYKVIYVKPLDYTFTAEPLNKIMPDYGSLIYDKNKKYTVSYLISEKNRFIAKFSGYIQNEDVKLKEEMVKTENYGTKLL